MLVHVDASVMQPELESIVNLFEQDFFLMEPSNTSTKSCKVIVTRRNDVVLLYQIFLLLFCLQIRMNCKQNETIARTYKPSSADLRTALDPGNRQLKNDFLVWLCLFCFYPHLTSFKLRGQCRHFLSRRKKQ